MRVPNNLSRGGLGFNMTPMIDVVFLLIIFFLVSSHLARQEVQLELDLPAAVSGRQADEKEGVRRVVVNILPDARDDRRIMVGGQLLDPREFGQMIGYERQRTTEPIEVRIRCDRNVAYREVEPVMLACAKAGVWNVTFAVIPGGSR